MSGFALTVDRLTLAHMDETPDRELMRQYGKGSEKAFEQLYARHKGPLYRFLKQRCFDAETADEIFQEVWTKVIRARTRYEPTARFTTWLYQLARNAWVDHVRHVNRRIRLVSDSDDDNSIANTAVSGHAGPVEQLAGDQLAQNFARALAQLPGEQQEAFLLHQEAGLTLPQIADVTDVGRETVKSRLRYAVRKLRESLSDDNKSAGVSA
ncbi:MAG: RNA polymerase sigma factor [Gammaproteobacteria bacterium]